MRTYTEIYESMKVKGDHRFSIYEALKVFEKEEGNWVADTQQAHELRGLQLELTGIRPGNCSGCMLEVVKNMIRWVRKYEEDMQNQIVEVKKPGRPKKV